MRIVNTCFAARSILVICVVLSGCGTEKTSWKQAETLHSKAAYQHFIEQYPDGMYAEKALLRIEALDFKQAETRNTVRAYRHYVETYPHGVYTEHAQLKIEILTLRSKSITLDGTK